MNFSCSSIYSIISQASAMLKFLISKSFSSALSDYKTWKFFSFIVRLQKAQDPATKWPRLTFKQPQVTSNVEADKTNPSPNLTHLLFIHLTYLACFLRLEEQRPLEAGEKLCFEFNWGHLEISRYHFEAGGGFKFWEYSQKCPLPQPIFLNITFSIFPRR